MQGRKKKPTSTTKKREAMLRKRAIKRGDLVPEVKSSSHRTKKQDPSGSGPGTGLSTRKLESSFVKLSPDFLAKCRALSASLSLPRPISPDKAVFPVHLLPDGPRLSCIRRPSWKFDQSKEQVERNEEGMFKKWLKDTDNALAPEESTSDTDMPQTATYFERNLEVYRQLWRVMEISQILLVLVDSRCPLIHYPPSLISYLGDRKHILVLTKVDITGPIRAAAWVAYFNQHYPAVPVVQVEAYAEKTQTSVHQGSKKYEPHIPHTFREQLVYAIRNLHQQMLQPPDKVKNDPNLLAKWKPPRGLKLHVDWDAVVNAGGNAGTVVAGTRPEVDDNDEPSFLTIGLIGQPNVGKSSLLNALFGTRKVGASKQPGMTKHFQTLFWTNTLRLVDCPGLVLPTNAVRMEMQVLSGVIPISRISAVPSCVHLAAQHLPLEQVYNLKHPSPDEVEDKRTWREGMTRPEKPKEKLWTSMDIMVAFADSKGWQTAKAGRPDTHRAGNAMLRSLAEGRISWGFWPPGTNHEEIEKHSQKGAGIWIPKHLGDGSEDEEESDDEEEEADGEDDEPEDHESSSESDPDTTGNRATGLFPANALHVEQGEDDQLSDEPSGEESIQPVTRGMFAALKTEDGEDSN